MLSLSYSLPRILHTDVFWKVYFSFNQKQKNIPWDGEHLFQSLMCQYFSAHGGILLYKFLARKKPKQNQTSIFFIWPCAERFRNCFHSFKHSEILCWHHVSDTQATYFYSSWVHFLMQDALKYSSKVKIILIILVSPDMSSLYITEHRLDGIWCSWIFICGFGMSRPAEDAREVGNARCPHRSPEERGSSRHPMLTVVKARQAVCIPW